MSLEHFFDWFARQHDPESPWLIVGKGPSFSKWNPESTSAYRVLALNHTMSHVLCDIAHAIDLDVVIDCADALLQSQVTLVMPWVPHVNNQPSDKTLLQWAAEHSVLQTLANQGRLKWYNLRTTKIRNGTGPVVQALCFSSEAAVSALGLAGVKRMRTVGVDGGTQYGEAFAHLANVTRLNNGHASYDKQFAGIVNSIVQFGLDFAPLNVQSPVRVFVGSQEEQMLSVRVLEYTIKKHASISTEIIPLHRTGVEFPMPRDAKNKPRTPFSFQRFAIPKLSNHQGLSIYLDSDMMVFTDIAKLWNTPMQNNQLLSAGLMQGSERKPQYSVMLMNCSELSWSPESIVGGLDEGKYSYEELMYSMVVVEKQSPCISEHWNALEHFEPQTCLLHYTDMSRQPWVSLRNRNGHLWVQALIDAVQEGFIEYSEIEEHVKRGWVRPSLLQQVKSNRANITRLNLAAVLRDRHFIPPYKHMLAA